MDRWEIIEAIIDMSGGNDRGLTLKEWHGDRESRLYVTEDMGRGRKKERGYVAVDSTCSITSNIGTGRTESLGLVYTDGAWRLP